MDFIYKRKINYYETDKMGVVHHSNYIRFLEEARCRWMEAHGLPLEDLEAAGYTIPSLEVYCKYKYHVTAGDVLLIEPIITEYNGVRMTVTYRVTEEKTGRTVIKAQTKHCFTNRELRPVNMKKHAPEIHAVFADAVTPLSSL